MSSLALLKKDLRQCVHHLFPELVFAMYVTQFLKNYGIPMNT